MQFEGFARIHGIPAEIVYRINFIFDELLTNIISYAYKDQNVHNIDIIVDLHENKVSVTIADDGIAFNPLTAKSPDTTLPLAEREVGGLGIHLVRKLTNKFDYRRRQDKNISILSIYFTE